MITLELEGSCVSSVLECVMRLLILLVFKPLKEISFCSGCLIIPKIISTNYGILMTDLKF